MVLIITIKVVPGSGRFAWKLDKTGQLKCYLVSQPEQGKANNELIKNIAKTLGITQASVVIMSGHTGRIKKVKIESAITFDQLLGLFGIERQIKMW